MLYVHKVSLKTEDFYKLTKIYENFCFLFIKSIKDIYIKYIYKI